MKKSVFIVAAIAAAAFTSCQQEPFTPQDEETVISEAPKVIYASVADDDTKAGMERYYDDGTTSYKYRHHWESGDVIYVYRSAFAGSKSIYDIYKDTYTCISPAAGTFSLTNSDKIESSTSRRRFNQYCAVFSSTGGDIVHPTGSAANNILTIWFSRLYY